MGHFAKTCSKKKVKEDSDCKAVAVKRDDVSDDDVAMSAHVPQEKRWGRIVLYIELQMVVVISLRCLKSQITYEL